MHTRHKRENTWCQFYDLMLLWHPHQMPEPPQLAPSHAKEQQLYSESLPDDWASHSISKGDPSHPLEKTHFGHLYPQSRSSGSWPIAHDHRPWLPADPHIGVSELHETQVTTSPWAPEALCKMFTDYHWVALFKLKYFMSLHWLLGLTRNLVQLLPKPLWR